MNLSLSSVLIFSDTAYSRKSLSHERLQHILNPIALLCVRENREAFDQLDDSMFDIKILDCGNFALITKRTSPSCAL